MKTRIYAAPVKGLRVNNAMFQQTEDYDPMLATVCNNNIKPTLGQRLVFVGVLIWLI